MQESERFYRALVVARVRLRKVRRAALYQERKRVRLSRYADVSFLRLFEYLADRGRIRPAELEASCPREIAEARIYKQKLRRAVLYQKRKRLRLA
jgi:hypothetical protein